MRLSPHTAQHLLGASSPVTVPRHPSGAFPRVRMRVPGLLGEPTGCGPSPCAPAFPASDSYAHTATPSGLGVSLQVSPQLLPARLPIPLGASHVHDPGLLRRPVGGGYPTIPSALCGSPTRARIHRPSGSGLFPLPGAEGVRLLLRLLATECVGCPHKQGRTGDHFPVGSHPLQVDAP